uniref:EGF-like domain-containing protein n=1 Tax=Periophthalmus magnuspinnatus TaxID=409849 RepID=A0A3B4AH76_9GOBI
MGYSTTDPADNFKWIDGSCSVPVEAYLCYYGYQQMCDALPSEGARSVVYTTPFNLLSTILTHVPFGSEAIVPCPNEKQETVLCMLQDNGLAGWSKNSPICLDMPLQYNWCDDANGGCEHFCKETGEQFFCECADGYQLGQDGQSCELLDACQEAPCEYECLRLSDGFRCACPEGYMLAPDERRCVDVDECLQSPCEQLCVNALGTFHCICRKGYLAGDDSECDDVDECASDPCEHACENTPGSHICHCHLGYSPLPEDPSRCQDIDECQIAGTCEQMCVNYEGGFECYCEVGYALMEDLYSCQKIGERDDQYAATPSFPWATHQTPSTEDYGPEEYEWTIQPAHTNWPAEVDQSLYWLTDAPKVKDDDIIWVTRLPEAENTKQALNLPTEGTIEPEDIHHSDPDLCTPSDWYEAEEETTTAHPILLPTSNVSAGARWVPIITPITTPEEEEIAKDYEDITASSKPFFPTKSNPPLDSSGVGNGVDLNSVQTDREQSQSSTWLLVGLLVPICIFIVVMVALGIVYCTRCAAQSRNNKNTTDCYHWISGAHDKQGAANPSVGVKTHV